MSLPVIRDPLIFRSGFALGPGEGKVIAQVGLEVDPDQPLSQIWELSPSLIWSHYDVHLTAIRIAVVPSSQAATSWLLGEGGYIQVVENGRIAEEMVDPSDEGPLYRGNLTDLRRIGRHFYTVGMSRQVYRREDSGWRHVDAGTVQPLGDLTIAGFCTIDGLNEDDIYAAGYNGEIWHFSKSKWQAIESPTNLVLTQLRVITPELAFACGQEGVLLQGSRDQWNFIDHGQTLGTFWGLEWFNDVLYLAGDDGLYCFEDDHLDPVDTGLPDPWTYRFLHAQNGALWAFGPRNVGWTDGKLWHDVTPS
jgi:hypothetical protein